MKAKFKFRQGDRVQWATTHEVSVPVGKGTVCGVASAELPVLGSQIIIRLDNILGEAYPYDTVVVFEKFLFLEG